MTAILDKHSTTTGGRHFRDLDSSVDVVQFWRDHGELTTWVIASITVGFLDAVLPSSTRWQPAGHRLAAASKFVWATG
jgi:hypothetical protein